MAANDCGFCAQLYNCQAGIVEKDFYTFAAKMLCEIAENTVPSGLDANVNIDEVGGVAVTIADFQDQNLVKIAGETLGANFYDQTLQAIQVSVVNDGALNAVNLTEIAGETLGANFYDQTLQAIQESIVANSAIEYNAGTSTAKTQRVAIATDANAVSATGNVASDAVDSGNPIKIGFLARTSDITAVSNADRVDGIADKVGKQINLPYAIPELGFKGTTSSDMTGTTSTQVVAASGSLKAYITSLTVSNLSTSVATRVDIQDGSGGTVIWQGPAAANGGGFTHSFLVPIPTTGGNGVFAVCGTTGAQVRVSAAGYYGV